MLFLGVVSEFPFEVIYVCPIQFVRLIYIHHFSSLFLVLFHSEINIFCNGKSSRSANRGFSKPFVITTVLVFKTEFVKGLGGSCISNCMSYKNPYIHKNKGMTMIIHYCFVLGCYLRLCTFFLNQIDCDKEKNI